MFHNSQGFERFKCIFSVYLVSSLCFVQTLLYGSDQTNKVKVNVPQATPCLLSETLAFINVFQEAFVTNLVQSDTMNAGEEKCKKIIKIELL